MLVVNKGHCNNRSQSGSLSYCRLFQGAGGEQRNPQVKRRIAQEENSLYGHKLLKKSRKFRQTNWLQLCLFVTVANLKKFVELHNYYPV